MIANQKHFGLKLAKLIIPSICQRNFVSQANQTYKRNYVLKVKASIIYKLPETEKVGEGGSGEVRE